MQQGFKNMIYAFLDLATLGKGVSRKFNGYKLKLPVRFSRYFPENYESANFKFLSSTCGEGDIVFDLGAHIGLFSCISAQIVKKQGKVFAFEPTPATTALLKTTIHINRAEDIVIPVQQAMGAEKGKTTFYISDTQGDNSNSLISYLDDRKLNGVEVELNTLDDFYQTNVKGKVRFIKIDVEGAECSVLKGGKQFFQINRPFCILAVHPLPIQKNGDNLVDIYDFFVQLNYGIELQGRPITRDEFLQNTELIDLHLRPL